MGIRFTQTNARRPLLWFAGTLAAAAITFVAWRLSAGDSAASLAPDTRQAVEQANAEADAQPMPAAEMPPDNVPVSGRAMPLR